ncbi:hypothetical protein CHLNCDRAFT_133895 [Chlorella variabilis]|uniref:Ysc84 actin-binding domain-containing protein n=1 Tax=Chlorella variabilis TaxID=554065 RepID=E1ZEI7_CHLVA|nr:hypothetical protein CHLNCDRAFT_133895 [Chlorella variabilis]EFN55670.1 hypothetical protein CHLNCDRAFT_133895 [Chlorella variabilis]|eukprot:XP_005847772.1 hypothetical protein CHLNCDRAFT_133895 [Chlorella variabilis]
MQQMNKWHELEDDASRATIIVQKLTSHKEELRESLPRGTEPMPRSELHYCNGLAFTFVRKLGAGISFEAGHGFVIRKIYTGERQGRPTWTWSAPLFLTVTAAGLGLTLGYTEIDSIIVLDTPEAVQSFTKSQWAVDTDLTGAAGGAVGAHLPATAANMSNMRVSDKTFTYSITKGVILDVSMTGLNYATDPAMNRGFYGGNASPQSILDGATEPPEPMQELYAVLDKVLNEYYDSVEGQAELQTQMQTQVEYASVGQVSIDVAGPASASAPRAEYASVGQVSIDVAGPASAAAPRAAAVPAAAAGGGGEPRAAVADEGGEISPAQEQPEPAAAGDVVPAGGAPEKEEKEDKAD